MKYKSGPVIMRYFELGKRIKQSAGNKLLDKVCCLFNPSEEKPKPIEIDLMLNIQ